MRMRISPALRAAYMIDSDTSQLELSNNAGGGGTVIGLTETIASTFRIPAGTIQSATALRMTYYGHVKNTSGASRNIRLRIIMGPVGITTSASTGAVTLLDTTHSPPSNASNERAIDGNFMLVVNTTGALDGSVADVATVGSSRMTDAGASGQIQGVASSTQSGDDKMGQNNSATLNLVQANDLILTVTYDSTTSYVRYTAHIAFVEYLE